MIMDRIKNPMQAIWLFGVASPHVAAVAVKNWITL